MRDRAIKHVPLIIAGAMAFGMLISLPIVASMALTGSPDAVLRAAEPPYTTYTIVDPGNGENGADVLTWAQIPGGSTTRTLSLTIGDTVNIRATTSPAARITLDFSNGQNRAKGNPPDPLNPSTVTGVAGVTYENVAIIAFGDLAIRDLSVEYAYGSVLTFKGVTWAQTSFDLAYIQNIADTYYYHNYPATLTVNGDCRFAATSATGAGAGIYVMLRSILELTIGGSGTLTVTGNEGGIRFLYDDYLADRETAQKAVLTINIPVIAKLTYYGSENGGLTLGSGSGSGMYRKYEVNGSGSLTAIATNENGTGANGELVGNGIFARTHELTFSGDLKIFAKGYGIRHGLYQHHCVKLTFDLTHDAVFEGGDFGCGLWINDVPNEWNRYDLVCKGSGNVVFRGGGRNSYGIWFFQGTTFNKTFAMSNDGKGRFLVYGGGYGSGMLIVYNSILDISGLNYDLALVGGETVPTRQAERYPWSGSYIPYLNRCSAGLLIDQEGCGVILGNNNLLCQGGANGGAGVDLYRAGNFTVESTGGRIYALGGKGAFGNGLFSGISVFSIKGDGAINAYDGYNNAGVQIGSNGNGAVTLGGDVTLNAFGGAKAPDVAGKIN